MYQITVTRHTVSSNYLILPVNRVSTKSRLKTIRRLNPLVIFSVKVRNSFRGKYFRHLTRVLYGSRNKKYEQVHRPSFS